MALQVGQMMGRGAPATDRHSDQLAASTAAGAGASSRALQEAWEAQAAGAAHATGHLMGWARQPRAEVASERHFSTTTESEVPT